MTGLVSQVDDIQEHLGIIIDFIAYAHIPLGVICYVGRRYCTDIGLSRTVQEIITPVVRESRLETVLIVETNEVCSITQPA